MPSCLSSSAPFARGRQCCLLATTHRPSALSVDWARTLFGISIEIVAKLAGQVGFVVLHRRWVVERSLAWINQHRRYVRDYERLPEHHEAIVRWAMIHTISKRLT